MAYLALKTLHVLFVVLFLGNVITAVLWKLHADRSGDPRFIAHTMAGVIRADRWFTIPGVIGILATGFAAAGIAGYPIFATPWIVWSLVLFGISGLAFSFAGPTQRRLLAVARAGVESGTMDWTRYRALSTRWNLWGTIATLAPLVALVLMVFKPTG